METQSNTATLGGQRWGCTGNSTGRKDSSSGRHSAQESSSRQGNCLGRGPTRTQCESKVWDCSPMGGGAGRRAGDAQDRAEPAASPGPSPQRWRNWGLGRTHELPKDPQRGCHKKLGILDLFYDGVLPGSPWKELQVRPLGEGYSSSFPAGRDQANLGVWGCARCRDMCKDSTARTWRRRRSGAWGTAGAKKPPKFHPQRGCEQRSKEGSRAGGVQAGPWGAALSVLALPTNRGQPRAS